MLSIAQSLPQLSDEALACTEKLTAHIKQKIKAVGGKLSFAEFMQAALYTPQWGYYMNTGEKFAAVGDFITAPELSPLFSRCLAAQCAEILTFLPQTNIVEFGAGSGVMATDILLHLETLNVLPAQYYIIEISPYLKTQQQKILKKRCPHLLDRVFWLDRMPKNSNAIVLLNEVLDALPVEQFVKTASGFQQRFVSEVNNKLVLCAADVENQVLAAALQYLEHQSIAFVEGYISEINLQITTWLQCLAQRLRQGIVLCVDYGYTRGEYYHPQRSSGTLQCHYQHRVHGNPLLFPGLQDITSHVDFTAVAEAAINMDLEVLGFTLQSTFLLNNGLLDLMATSTDMLQQLKYSQQVKQLTLPNEMGTLFKVIALGRGIDFSLQGFASQDRLHEL